MTEAKRQMHIGVLAVGAGNHIAGWRFPDAGASSEDFPLLLQIAQTAERGKHCNVMRCELRLRMGMEFGMTLGLSDMRYGA